MKEEVDQGIYRHYKGGEYEVLFVAVHTETEEPVVVYRDVNNPEKIWVRPLEVFNEKVSINGDWVDRFEKVN